MFRSAIIKLTNICNLDCTYCYMFNLEDKSYQHLPKHMPIETALLFLDRVEEYCKQNKLERFQLTLHGGEPTLWPKNYLYAFVLKADSLEVDIQISLQTNAFKIDYELYAFLAEHGVSIGISVDGPEATNDKFRVDHRGKGSYKKIMKNVGQLIDWGFSSSIGGFLTVIDPLSDPEVFFNWVKSLPIKRVDVLWPIEFNHGNTPWKNFGISEFEYINRPIYGNWLRQLFDLWYLEDQPDIFIRHFFEIICLMMGSKNHTDSLVNDKLSMFVLNTDGGFEYHDYFRAYRDGGTKTPYNVFDHEIIALKQDEIFARLLNLGSEFPMECKGCSAQNICGGGFLPGRMDHNDEMLLNRKSVLCYDHHFFLTHVDQVLRESIAHLTASAAA